MTYALGFWAYSRAMPNPNLGNVLNKANSGISAEIQTAHALVSSWITPIQPTDLKLDNRSWTWRRMAGEF